MTCGRARIGLLVMLLVALCAAPASGARSAEVRKSYKSLLGSAVPRRGVQHRSLVLVPLVLRAAAAGNGIVVDASRLTWVPGDEKKPDRSAALLWEKGMTALGGDPVLLPSGQLLRAGTHERLLLRPTLLRPGVPAVLRTRSFAPVPKTSTAVGTIPSRAGLAAPEFRHTMFLVHSRDALRDLLALEASALDLDPKKIEPSLEVLAAKSKARVEACAKALLPVGKAFGGTTVGHAAFLGGGLVQLVLAADPKTYASYLPRATHGLGLSLVVWERMYHRAAGEPKPVTWEDYLAATGRVLTFLESASFKREPRRDERGAKGELWRVRATRATRKGRPPDVGWLLTDEDASPIWFEAWPDSAPLLPPVATPSSPGTKPGDDNTKEGAATWYFLERFYSRFPWRREPEWLRTTSRPPLRKGKTKR